MTTIWDPVVVVTGINDDDGLCYSGILLVGWCRRRTATNDPGERRERMMVATRKGRLQQSTVIAPLGSFAKLLTVFKHVTLQGQL